MLSSMRFLLGDCLYLSNVEIIKARHKTTRKPKCFYANYLKEC